MILYFEIEIGLRKDKRQKANYMIVYSERRRQLMIQLINNFEKSVDGFIF